MKAAAAEAPRLPRLKLPRPKRRRRWRSEPAVQAGPKAATVEARRDSDGLRVTFTFTSPTPAAMFRRADTVWLVFDKTGSIDLDPIRAKGGAIIGDVSPLPLDKGQAIRIRLNRPQMPSLESDPRGGGIEWTLTFADRVAAPPLPLMVLRNITDPALANVSVPLANPGQLYKLVDPDAGDTLLVVTAPPPVRGFIKRQDFVELSLLESGHGVVVHPNSDDVSAEVGSDKVMLGRPGGLTLSSADVAAERATAAVRPLFDPIEWRKNQDENFHAAARRADQGRRHRRARAEDPGPARPRQFLHGARDVSGSARGHQPDLFRDQAGQRRGCRDDGACGGLDPDRPSRARAEGPRQSRDRQRLRFPVVEGLCLCPPGKMGGCARKIQERRIRDRLAAAGPAAHRHRGCDAGFARGQGLRRRLAAAQRARRDRRSRPR